MDAVLVVLIMAVILLGPIALIGWACLRVFRNRNRPVGAAPSVLPWPPSESASRVLAEMTPLLRDWGYALTTEGEARIGFTKSYRPAWLIVPCVFFFPLGMLSLLYCRTVDLSFGLSPHSSGSDVVVSGMAPLRLLGEISRTLDGLGSSV
jgi:hypothetical protein